MKNVYVNIDINSITVPFLNNTAKQERVTEAMLYPLVDIYKETVVTDILFNIFAQSSATETEYWDSYSDIYERRFENGKEVDYTEYLYGPHRIIRELGIDVFDVWIKRARENGHRAWISLSWKCSMSRTRASLGVLLERMRRITSSRLSTAMMSPSSMCARASACASSYFVRRVMTSF